MKELLIEYLKDNCIGYDNRQKAYQLMKIVDIKDHKTFRRMIEDIRQSDNRIFICSEAGKDGGYWLPTTKEEIVTTIDHLESRAYEMIKTAKILREKVGM
jgi:threonine synthase